jgi:hypothetical protein
MPTPGLPAQMTTGYEVEAFLQMHRNTIGDDIPDRSARTTIQNSEAEAADLAASASVNLTQGRINARLSAMFAVQLSISIPLARRAKRINVVRL